MADKRISQLIERVTIANNDVLPIVASGATTTNKVTVSTLQDWMQSNLDVGVTSIGITIGTSGTNINVTGSPVTTSGNITINIPTASATNRGVLSSTDWTTFNNKLSSVGLTMPSAFTVTNSPLTSNGTIAVTGAGTVGQYIRGDGSLADFPSSGGGGASVSFYLNGSVSQGTIGGIAYQEVNKTPIIGAGTDFTINANGYIASFITDAGDPGLLEIPAGNWNFETYFSASSGGGTPSFYVELYKVNSAGTPTLIASGSAAPELIAFGTAITPYFSNLAVPFTTLALTDRLALRYYVTHSGRTITLHTENSHLCQIITTFTTGLTALNGLTAQVQNFATGTSGTNFNISSAGSTHTFNLPDASATARGVVTTGSQTIAGIKTFSSNMNADGGVRLPAAGTALPTFVNNISGSGLSSSGSNGFGFNNANNFYFSGSDKGGSVFVVNNTATRNYTFQDTSGVIALTSDLNSYVPTTRTITINGTSQDLSANRTYNVGTVTSVGLTSATSGVTIGSSPITSSGNITISIATATSTQNGLLSSTDWSTFNNKQNAITLTTTGTSGAATLVGSTLNIPQYQSVLTNPITGTGTINQIPKFSGTSTLTNSNISDNGTEVNIQSRVFFTSGGQQFVFTPNLATTSNRIETTGSLPLEIVSGGNIRFAAGGTTPQITLGSNGNVSIGDTSTTTASGYQWLRVNGSTGGVIELTSSSSRVLQIQSNGTSAGAKIQTVSSSPLILGTDGTDRLTISSTGAATFSSSVTASGGFEIPNGQFYRARRSSGNLLTDMIGIPSGTDDVRLLTTGDFNIINGSLTNLMTVKNSGNVGIGTSSPIHLLQVANGNLGLYSNSYSNTGLIRMYGTDGLEKYQQGLTTGGDFYQYTFTGLNHIFYTNNGSERMRITSGGALVVGNGGSIDSGGAAAGDIAVSANAQKIGYIPSSTSNRGYFEPYDGSGFVNIVSTFATAGIRFMTGNSATERMRITSGGNVGVGTNNPNGGRLHIADSGADNTGLYINNNTFGHFFTKFSYQGSVVGSISYNGSNTVYTTTSDYRLKENVNPVESALSKLSQLKPCTFNFKSNPDEEVMGFIAHEVQEVIPQAVIGQKDEVRIEQVEISPAELDEEGNVITEAVIQEKEVPVYQGIDHSILVPLLVASIQELKAEIEALKSQING